MEWSAFCWSCGTLRRNACDSHGQIPLTFKELQNELSNTFLLFFDPSVCGGRIGAILNLSFVEVVADSLTHCVEKVYQEINATDIPGTGFHLKISKVIKVLLPDIQDSLFSQFLCRKFQINPIECLYMGWRYVVCPCGHQRFEHG